MKNKKLWDEAGLALSPQILLKHAREAAENAYAPYSHFRVGAAVLFRDGSILKSCNVENASYGLSMCAERSAMSAMVGRGLSGPLAIAVSGGKEGEPEVYALLAGLAVRCFWSSTLTCWSCLRTGRRRFTYIR